MQNYKWTLRLSLLTIPLLLFSIFLAGAGHGTYIPAMFLFPFSLVSILFFHEIKMPFIIMAILQYPIYGFVIDIVRRSEKRRWIPFLILFAHIILALIIISVSGEK